MRRQLLARKFILEFFIKQFTQGLVFICLGCIINICRERTTRDTSNHLNISLFIDVLNFNYQNSEKI
ncbi:TPA: hypothetical protein GF146_12540 [Escherichia coli]|nr:hypothetical protein [Escherichia coli]HAH3689736.1 hypothetical protein [Escherichia coli]